MGHIFQKYFNWCETLMRCVCVCVWLCVCVFCSDIQQSNLPHPKAIKRMTEGIKHARVQSPVLALFFLFFLSLSRVKIYNSDLMCGLHWICGALESIAMAFAFIAFIFIDISLMTKLCL